MLQKHFYHYTSYMSARDILENDTDNGLKPVRRFIYHGHGRDLPDKAHAGAVFGMLRERPREYTESFWSSNLSSVFNDVLKKAKGHLQPTILLKAHIAEEDDVYVADWGVHFHPAFDGTEVSPKCIVDEVKEAYWRTVVPLRDYVEGAYRIPEVVCFNRIPLERLEIAKVIPGSEMKRYIETGAFDPKALARDKQKHAAMARRLKIG